MSGVNGLNSVLVVIVFFIAIYLQDKQSQFHIKKKNETELAD